MKDGQRDQSKLGKLPLSLVLFPAVSELQDIVAVLAVGPVDLALHAKLACKGISWSNLALPVKSTLTTLTHERI